MSREATENMTESEREPRAEAHRERKEKGGGRALGARAMTPEERVARLRKSHSNARAACVYISQNRGTLSKEQILALVDHGLDRSRLPLPGGSVLTPEPRLDQERAADREAIERAKADAASEQAAAADG